MAACCQAVVATTLAARLQNLKLELLWALLPLVGALLLGAVILSWAKQWRKRAAPTPSSANEQLAHFRTLYERGELKPDEFERVRARLAEHLRAEMAATPGEEPLEITSLAPPPKPEGPPDRQTPTEPPPKSPPENSTGTQANDDPKPP
jgi:hypothetical protein